MFKTLREIIKKKKIFMANPGSHQIIASNENKELWAMAAKSIK